MKILVYSRTNELIGGVERFIEAQIDSLLSLDIELSLYFEEFSEARKMKIPNGVNILFKKEVSNASFDKVIIHKFNDDDLIESLSKRFETIAVIHDHEYYCKRGHKYYPNNKNCNQAFNNVSCGLCSGFGLKKSQKFPFLKIENNNTADKLKILKSFNMFVVISDYMKSNLELNGINENLISIARPFVSKQSWEATPPKKKQGLYVGQLIKGKGILKLARKYKEKNWTLSIVGTGKDMAGLNKLAMGNEYIKTLGFQNPDGFYRESNFLVFSSTWSEPFGLAGIEAMSFGLPVVAFNVGGVSDWLRHGENGFLVDEGDYDAFFYYCDKLSNDEKLTKQLGENAKRFVRQNFAFENYLSDWKKILGYR